MFIHNRRIINICLSPKKIPFPIKTTKHNTPCNSKQNASFPSMGICYLQSCFYTSNSKKNTYLVISACECDRQKISLRKKKLNLTSSF